MELTSGSYKFYWKLDNFCFCNMYSNSELLSPVYQIGGPYRSKWQLCMFPNGWGIEKYVGIYLKRVQDDPGPNEISILFRICLIDNNGESEPDGPYHERTFATDVEWGINNFIKRSDITSNSSFVVNNTLTILCDFTILDSNVDPISQAGTRNQEFADASRVSDALRLMYRDSAYSDITLRGNSKQFSLHRCILKARLPSLLEELIHAPSKVYSNDNATDKILLYVYTGKLDLKDFGVSDIRRYLTEFGLNNMQLQSKIISRQSEFIAYTYFVVNRYTFSWKIKSSLLNDDDDITSSMFVDDANKLGFLTFLTKQEDNSWKISIRVISDDDIFIKCLITLAGVVNFREEYENCVQRNYADVQCVTSIRMLDGDLYFNQNRAPNIGEYFTLNFDFTYPTEEINSSVKEIGSSCESTTSSSHDDTENLMRSLEALYRGQLQEGDITIGIRKSRREFKAHKCILSARSPVFRRMLDLDMVEKLENRINMNPETEGMDGDVFADVVDKFLLYTYCGKLETADEALNEDLQSLIGMYFIGEQYDLY